MRWKTSPCSAARFARPRRPSSADGSGRATSACMSAAKMTRAFAGCSIGPISSTSPAAAFSRTRCCGGDRAAASEWTERPQPDPRPAILAFHRELAALGITLIVMPTPVKPGVHPEKLVASYPPDGGTAQNASYAAFVEWLAREGIVLFDPANVLEDARRSGRAVSRQRHALAARGDGARRGAPRGVRHRPHAAAAGRRGRIPHRGAGDHEPG